MSTPDLTYVTPDVLKWARERSGLSYQDIQKSLKISKEQIDQWEKGNGHPPFAKAQEMANRFHVPFGYLFLSNAPATDITLPDFRGRTIQATSDFLELLNDILLMQDWYRDYAEQNGVKPLPFIGKFAVNGIPNVAGDIRKTLSINDTLRRRAITWSGYLSALSSQAEDNGILVMRSGVVGNNPRRKLAVSEFQGFAISDPRAPILFINGSDFKTAQIFTTAHELAHLWIGESGISNPDPTHFETLNSVESFCNKVAAETLVPRDEFMELCDGKIHSGNIDRLAHHFWVSTLVILRRAYDTQKLSASEFSHLAAQERKKQREASAAGGDYYRNVFARHGARFTSAILAELRRGNVLYREAAGLLGMKVPTLVKMAERYS